MKIAVVGAGHIGLVVGTGLAENGHFVTCVDRDPSIIERLSGGKLTIYEPGLEELMVRNIEEERLRFTTDLEATVQEALLVFICVGTPSLPDGTTDMSEVLASVEQVAKAMPSYRIIVIKSTCPLGTSNRVRDFIAERTTQPFDIVVNPEFLKEGAAVDDFMRPDRVVIGCEDVRVQEIMKELYAPFMRTGKPILCMDFRSAEMVKYAVNVMLAARISLMNELANLCAAYGADVNAVRDGLMADQRLGSTYLFPGLGFGGSCLPKDLLACAHLAREHHVPCDMIEAITAVNARQVAQFAQRIVDYYGGVLSGKRIAVWGASFKPRTDDIREAPALRVIDALLEAGAEVSVYDPVAAANVREHYGDRVTVAPKQYAAIEGADGLAIATEWREFHRPDFDRMAAAMRERVVFDGRNLYTPKELAKHGFRYLSIGRADV